MGHVYILLRAKRFLIRFARGHCFQRKQQQCTSILYSYLAIKISFGEWVSEICCLASYATIFQLYMWRHLDVYIDVGGLKKKFDLRSGSKRHRHFEGFFNVLVQAPTRGHPFTVFQRNCSISVAFYDAHWDMVDLFSS